MVVGVARGEYNLELSYATVYHWVHYRLKAKLKVPRPRSPKQDGAAVELLKTLLSRADNATVVGQGKRLRYLCQIQSDWDSKLRLAVNPAPLSSVRCPSAVATG